MRSCVVKFCALALFVCVVSSAPVDERQTSSAESPEEEGKNNYAVSVPDPVTSSPASIQTTEQAVPQVEGQDIASSAQETVRTIVQGETIPVNVPQSIPNGSQSQRFFAQPEEVQAALNLVVSAGSADISEPTPVVTSADNEGQMVTPESKREVVQTEAGPDNGIVAQTAAASPVAENGQMNTEVSTSENQMQAVTDTAAVSQINQNNEPVSVSTNGQIKNEQVMVFVASENGQESVPTSVTTYDAPSLPQGLETVPAQSQLSNQVPQSQDEETRSKRQDYSYASAGSGSDYGGFGGYGGSESQAESQSASIGFGPFHATFSESEASSSSGGGRYRDFNDY